AVPMRAGLHGGFAGVAWAVAHLMGWLLDAEDDHPTRSLDAALYRHLNGASWTGDYDLISGLAGLGVYAAERVARCASGEMAAACLERVIHLLSALAERAPAGTTWLTPPGRLGEEDRARCPGGYYNLGVAHGVPGVIGLLGLVLAPEVAPRLSRPAVALARAL